MLQRFPILTDRRGLIILTLLTIAMISAIALSFIADLCGGCASSAKMAPVPGLNIIGAVYYGLTIAALVWFGLRKATVAPIYFAAGVHAVLLYLLAVNETFCANCLTCAVCVFAAAAVAFYGRTVRFAALSAVAGLATCVISFTSIQMVFMALERQDAEKLIAFSSWPKQSRGPIKVTIFAKDECHRCQDFKKTTLVRLKQIYGSKLVYDIRKPPGRIRLPSLVIGGDKPNLFVGRPTWKDLSAAIDNNLKTAESTSLSATGSGAVQ